MSSRWKFLAAAGALAFAVIVALIAYHAGRSSGMKQAGTSAAGAPPSEVTATVRTMPAREGTLTKTITAYGSVVPAPGGLNSLSVPFECRIEQVSASEGQAVSKGETLIVVTGSTDAKLALAQPAPG